MTGSAPAAAGLGQFITTLEAFDRGLRAIDDEALEAFWAWEAYDEEGVRFGILRTAEQVADAAIEIAARRLEGPSNGRPEPLARPPSRAERILGRYLVAWRELWSVADRADAVVDVAPAEGEWALRQILDHLVEADLGFLVTIRNGLEQRRDGIAEPERVASDEAWLRLAGVDEDPWRAAFAGSLGDMRAFHRAARDRIVERLAGITDEELGWSSPFWDGVHPEPIPPRPVRIRTSASTRSRPRRRSRPRWARRARSSDCCGSWLGRPATSRRRRSGRIPAIVEAALAPLIVEIATRSAELVHATEDPETPAATGATYPTMRRASG